MIIIVITKGEAPMMTSSILPRLRKPCTTSRLIPTGGVIIASSIRMMMMIPNHTGSKPALNMIGAMIGTVATIIDKGFHEHAEDEVEHHDGDRGAAPASCSTPVMNRLTWVVRPIEVMTKKLRK